MRIDAFYVTVLSDWDCPLEVSFLGFRVAVAFGRVGLKKVQLSPDLAPDLLLVYEASWFV